jgi:hypothetical protein
MALTVRALMKGRRTIASVPKKNVARATRGRYTSHL